MSKLNSKLLSKGDKDVSDYGDGFSNQNMKQINIIKSKSEDQYESMNEADKQIELTFDDKSESSIIFGNSGQQGIDQILLSLPEQDLNSPEKVITMKQSKSKIKQKKYKNKNVPFKWSTYKFLLNYPMKHWRLTIVSNVLIIITTLLGVYLPTLIGQLLDSTTKNKSEEVHKDLSVRFLIILLVLSILQFFRAFYNQIWQANIYNDMRHDVLEQFLEFDMTFYRKYRGGEIISRMTNDLSTAKAAVSGNIILLFKNTIVIFSNIVVLSLLSWKLTLAILVTMPVFTIATMFYSRLSKKLEKMNQQQQADITALTDEIVSGIVTVKSFCGEQIEIKKFDKQLGFSMQLAYKRAYNNGFYQFMSSFFTQLGTLIVLWYGGKLVMTNDDLSPGELASFIFYSVQLSNAQQTLSDAYSKIISSTGAFQGVLEMLRYESIVRDYPEALESNNLSGQIEFQNLYFQYPGNNVQVLKNLCLTIQKGEYVAFVGMSGCGKSTIVQLIERFYDPQSGSIIMDGTDIKRIKLKSLRRQIGLVSQEPTLFEGTLASNITYGVENYTQQDLDWAVRASGSASFINDKSLFPKGLKTFVGEKGFTLSGGQKQRIAIARALIKKPKILIFDEATSALDAESEYQVQSSIDDLIQEENNTITIIVIAHRLSTIVNCNKICVLQNGMMVEQGTHQSLLELNGIYNSLVIRQMQGMIDLTNQENQDDNLV